MKQILILGSTGMAGHVLTKYLELTNKYKILNLSYKNKLNKNTIIIDVKDDDELLSAFILETKPDIIINCIGVLINGSKDSSENAIYLNSYFPHRLVLLANKISSKVIHISTDCVFTGQDGDYDENSFTDAPDIYGRSKALGEINTNKHLTIRTSIIGPEIKKNGEGLLNWFFNETKVKGFSQVYWTGVTTLELSKAIEYTIENNITGLMHLTNCIKISKYELLLLINEKAKLKIRIEKELGKVVDKSLRTIRTELYKVQDYEKMIIELVNWIICNKSIYQGLYPKIFIEVNR